MSEKRQMHFRFQDLEIWQRSAALSMRLFRYANQLEDAHKFRFAEQLRGATLSITNNIAEGSGANSKAEFRKFLGYARRSIFETANILMIISQLSKIKIDTDHSLAELDEISRMIKAFSRSL